MPKNWVRDAYWRIWKLFFQWCWLEYEIPNPMARVQRPQLDEIEPRVLEREELAMVVAAAVNLQDKAIVALALDSGVRASEFGRLRIADVSTDTIRVWGKGRKRVRVPISPEVYHLLQVLIDHDGHRGPQALLFSGRNGLPLSRFAIYRIVRHCMDRAGIPGPKRGSHLLRHSLATNFLANGGDLATLQRIMRHKNIATTQKYVHLAMHDVVEKHHLYSPARDAIRGAQWSFFDNGQLVKEAEAILKEADHGS
ncbi:Tyrosine recombinase XerD [subsurface metagenome]